MQPMGVQPNARSFRELLLVERVMATAFMGGGRGRPRVAGPSSASPESPGSAAWWRQLPSSRANGAQLSFSPAPFGIFLQIVPTPLFLLSTVAISIDGRW
ncbi:hypothetical protein MTO96_011151 [Rhipicephalus appendiculatus]